jgi:hypothetical protein
VSEVAPPTLPADELATLDDVCRGPGAGDPPANRRWVLAQLLEETGRHAGHAGVLRELSDSSAGR